MNVNHMLSALTRRNNSNNTYKRAACICVCFIMIIISNNITAQIYTPVSVTGFNQDVVAESGANAFAVTTTMIDGNALISNHILYTADFATTNGLAGGIYNSGAIVSGNYTFQMAPYNDKNALYLSKNAAIDSTLAAGTLVLSTPASFSRLSLVVFSTEGSSNINVDLNYTDGTTQRVVTNANVQDWFWGTDAVYEGFGRINRGSSAPYSVDGYSSNPRFYKQDIEVPCQDQSKLVESVTITDTSANTLSRALVLALSGVAYQPAIITPTILPARCGNDNGLIALNITGGVGPFTYTWNTTPVQHSSVASDLAVGAYTCSITDGNGCVNNFTAVVPEIASAAVEATASKDVVCSGETVTLSIGPGSATTTYTWMPGNFKGASVTVTADTTTSFVVTSLDNFGCASTDTVRITVNPTPTAGFTVSPDTVCAGTAQTVTFTGTAGSSAAYDWNNFAGATVQSGSGQGPYSIVFNSGGTYNLQLQVTENGCASAIVSKQVNVYAPITTPVVTGTATGNSVTFTWQPVPGATGYQVSINGGAYEEPGSGNTGTTHSVTGLQPSQTVTISVIALGVQTCQNSIAGTASAETWTDEIFIPNSFTPNQDGRNDLFKIYGNAIAGMEMKIFNQWGELIYTGSDLQTGWDGRHRGKQQPSGVYIYAIRVKLQDGSEIIRKGSVNLVR